MALNLSWFSFPRVRDDTENGAAAPDAPANLPAAAGSFAWFNEKTPSQLRAVFLNVLLRDFRKPAMTARMATEGETEAQAMAALAADGVNALAAALAPTLLFDGANGRGPGNGIALAANRSFDDHSWLMFVAQGGSSSVVYGKFSSFWPGREFKAAGDKCGVGLGQDDSVVVERASATTFNLTRVGVTAWTRRTCCSEFTACCDGSL